MKHSTRKFLRLALYNFLVYSLDMAGIWLVYFLVFGLTPIGPWGWFWLVTIGLAGRWVVHCLIGIYQQRAERDRVRTTLAAIGFDQVIQLHHYEAVNLLKLFGGEQHGRVSLVHLDDGHSGPGLYVWHTDYPEEGSLCISLPNLVKREA